MSVRYRSAFANCRCGVHAPIKWKLVDIRVQQWILECVLKMKNVLLVLYAKLRNELFNPACFNTDYTNLNDFFFIISVEK